MKLKNLFLSLLALTGSVQAGETCDSYRMFYDGGLLIPGNSDPAYKQQLFEKTGTGFILELFAGHWAIDHQAPGYNDTVNLGLLYGRIDQRVAIMFNVSGRNDLSESNDALMSPCISISGSSPARSYMPNLASSMRP